MSLPNPKVVLVILNYYMTIRKKTWTLDDNEIPVVGTDGHKKYEICMDFMHTIKTSKPTAALWEELILKAKSIEEAEFLEYETRSKQYFGLYASFQDNAKLALTMQAIRGYCIYNLNEDAAFKDIKLKRAEEIDKLNAEIISDRKNKVVEETIKIKEEKKNQLVKENNTLLDCKNYSEEFFQAEIKANNAASTEKSFTDFERNVMTGFRPLPYLEHCYKHYDKAQKQEDKNNLTKPAAKPAAKPEEVKSAVNPVPENKPAISKPAAIIKPATEAPKPTVTKPAAATVPIHSGQPIVEAPPPTALTSNSVFKEPPQQKPKRKIIPSKRMVNYMG